MATKNIVPRAAGEGGLGRIDKPWGGLYAVNIPIIDTNIITHNTNKDSHSHGIAGHASTMSALQTPVTINNILFDGSKNIDIPITLTDDSLTEAEVGEIFDTIMR